MYKLIKDYLNQEANMVHRLSDNAFIPFDPANTDYQQYLLLGTANISLYTYVPTFNVTILQIALHIMNQKSIKIRIACMS
jgi:hypothetical protein